MPSRATVSLTSFLVAWRTIPLHDREVVDALVDPTHAGPSPELAQALRGWPGTHYWSDEPDGRHIVFTRPTVPRTRDAWPLHALLFAATLFTTTLAGAIITGAVPADPSVVLAPGTWGAEFFRAWTTGLTFSVPLLAILLSHELGHYLTARRYQLDVSPPFFLPAPPIPVLIGTLGAFIRLRTILAARRFVRDLRRAAPRARRRTGRAAASDRVRRVVRNVRHRAEPAAHGPARRRAHPVRRAAPLARACGARVLGAHHVARLVLDRLADLGVRGAGAVARPAGSPAGARRVSAVAAVPPLARMGESGPVPHHLRSGTVPVVAPSLLRNSHVLISLHKPATGSACPHNRRDPPQLQLTRSSTTCLRFASTDKR